METRLRLQPGQNGTKALVKKYGDRLVCVRYLYDVQTRTRHKTVELIEETVPWHPRDSRERHNMRPAATEHVLVRVEYNELNLRSQVKQAGGRWRSAEQAWLMPYDKVVSLDLQDRVLD